MKISKGESCSAYKCSNNRGKNPNLSFFRFPRDPERYESNKVEWNRQYSYRRFVGCIKNIELQVNSRLFSRLLSNQFSQVQDGCMNKCHSRNKCVFGGRCVNLYETTVCNCFQTGHQGTMCSDDAISILTVRGNSYISYKIYDWDDKVHSDVIKISISFRTWFDDSFLFYGDGERPVKNFISASLKGGKIRFTITEYNN
uniref:EGF-like domain-containing protein n=1 Tax=Strigamia maritima TaxID=126957 RepID=T1JI32_STRMM